MREVRRKMREEEEWLKIRPPARTALELLLDVLLKFAKSEPGSVGATNIYTSDQ